MIRLHDNVFLSRGGALLHCRRFPYGGLRGGRHCQRRDDLLGLCINLRPSLRGNTLLYFRCYRHDVLRRHRRHLRPGDVLGWRFHPWSSLGGYTLSDFRRLGRHGLHHSGC